MLALALYLAASGDAVDAAIIAGVFSMFNTLLLAVQAIVSRQIRKDQNNMRAALTAPRRLIYDQDGKPIGTVLDLQRAGGWDAWLAPKHGRREDDPPSD